MQTSAWTVSSFVILSSFCLSIGLVSPTASVRPLTAIQSTEEISGAAASAKRVAILPPVFSVYAAIDTGIRHVIATSHFVRKEQSKSIFGSIFPELALLPLASASGVLPDPEQILALHPDAILAWSSNVEPLHKIGYPGIVELANSNYRNLSDLRQLWTILGNVAGRRQRAESLLTAAEVAKNALQNMLPVEAQPTILPIGLTPSVWWLGGNETNLTYLADSVGAVYPTNNRIFSGPTDVEVILSLDPDILLISNFGGPGPDAIYNDLRLAPLKAVHLRHIYTVPYYTMTNAPVDEYLCLLWLAEIVHPSIPPMTRAAYRTLYARAYGYFLTDEQIDEALVLRENAGSANYRRFQR